MRLGTLSISLALVAGSLSAQTVWQVPQGADLQPFIDGAASGDILELQGPGWHPSFYVSKDLTIVGVPGAMVFGNPTTIDVSGSRRIRFVDFTFRPEFVSPYSNTQVGNTLVTGAGEVVFERCEFYSHFAGGFTGRTDRGALTVVDARVVLDHCVLHGEIDSVGLQIDDADVVAVSCDIRGAQPVLDDDPHGGGAFFHGGHGVVLHGASTLHMSDCSVEGGNRSPDSSPVFHGIDSTDPSSRVWITDSEVRGGHGLWADGGHALHGSVFHYARCTLLGGTGTPPGGATLGTATHDPTLVGVSDTDTLAVGGAYTATFRADPGATMAVLFSPGPLDPIELPGILAQPIWNDGTTLIQFALGTTDASGDYVFSFTLPNSAALEYAPMHFYGARGVSLPIQLAPVVGGLLR